ncbi:MAG: hypothetical protein HYR62_03155 [Actinobacteria bacterium]|nr:hypothetical protein [Actinomycetota bacterium]MBI3686134.1 hypothetical protein [Actinomycetota bacterium]
MANFDPKKVSTLDWVLIGAGGLAFIDSFLPWYTASFNIAGFVSGSQSVSAWGVGFAAWFSVLLLVASAALVLGKAADVNVALPIPTPLATLGASALALLLILLRWVTLPSNTGPGASSGAGFGLYLGLLCALAAGGASFVAFRAAGGDFRQLRRGPGSSQPPTA